MKRFFLFFLIAFFSCIVFFIGCIKEEPEEIILRIGNAHPDRNSGIGAIVERLTSEFSDAHPNVIIKIESLQNHVMNYAETDQLPDVFMRQSTPAVMNPLIEGGFLLGLNKNDFTDFHFLPGALETNEFNGALYGIPATGHMWVIYVNRSLFERAGVPLPVTWEDITASVPRFRAIGIIPVVTNGLEGWPLSIFFDNIVHRINGDFDRNYNAITRRNNVRFTDPDFIQAARYIQDLIRARVFNPNLTLSDYGDARYQFVNQRAAMYMMGSWEMDIVENEEFSQSFRNNVDVIKFPEIRGGRGAANEPLLWFSDNFVVSANLGNKEAAFDYIKFLTERLGQYSWEMGAGIPAQKVEPQPTDSSLGKKLLQISAEATLISGRVPGFAYGSGAFEQEHQNLMRLLCSLTITPEEFAQRLDAAAVDSML